MAKNQSPQTASQKARVRALSLNQHIARTVVPAIGDHLPAFPDLFGDVAVNNAAVDAFIRERVAPDANDLRSAKYIEDRNSADEIAISEALSPELRRVFLEYQNRRTSMEWIQQEIAYRVGIAFYRALMFGGAA